MSCFCLSSLAKKLIMSISGAFLMVFLVVHLGANLTALFSQELYNEVCHFMDTNLLIRVMVPVLAAGFAVHIAFALLLTFQNFMARGEQRYAVAGKSDVSWSSRNMFVLGVIVLGFLALHLFHFWAKMQLQTFLGLMGMDAVPNHDPYTLVRELFGNPVYSVVYLIWIWALWFHLTHGFWSAFQSMGLNNANWLPRLKVAGTVYAWVIALGFSAIPIYFLFF
jgi:succinate dehydrogenase / fumarate reductase cytochrome b subunit